MFSKPLYILQSSKEFGKLVLQTNAIRKGALKGVYLFITLELRTVSIPLSAESVKFLVRSRLSFFYPPPFPLFLNQVRRKSNISSYIVVTIDFIFSKWST